VPWVPGPTIRSRTASAIFEQLHVFEHPRQDSEQPAFLAMLGAGPRNCVEVQAKRLFYQSSRNPTVLVVWLLLFDERQHIERTVSQALMYQHLRIHLNSVRLGELLVEEDIAQCGQAPLLSP